MTIDEAIKYFDKKRNRAHPADIEKYDMAINAMVAWKEKESKKNGKHRCDNCVYKSSCPWWAHD